MKIYGTYKNINNVPITVVIYNTDLTDVADIEIGESSDVKFAADAVTIEQDGDDLFEPLRTRSATIRLQSKIYLGDYLYAANYNSIIVNIFRDDECVFAGVVTPASYNQGFADVWETVDIECVDVLSTLQKRSYITDGDTYDNLRNNITNISFKDMLNLLKSQRYAVENLPELTPQMAQEWQVYDYIKVGDKYVAQERKITEINSDSAVATTLIRNGQELPVTLVQGAADDLCNYDGLNYFKNYKHVEINGVSTNTGDWVRGNPAPMPTVVGETWVADGVVRAAAYSYYVHEHKILILSDGRQINGDADRVGQQLQYTNVVSTATDTIENGGEVWYRQIPCVDVDGEKTYFREDSTPWRKVGGTGLLEGFVDGSQAFGVMVEGSPETVTPENVVNVDGLNFFATNSIQATDLSELLTTSEAQSRVKHITHLDALTGDPNDTMQLDSLCEGCEALETFSITADYIDSNDNMFTGCTALNHITINDSTAMVQVVASDLEGVDVNCVVKVSASLYDDYMADEVWNKLIIIELDE